MFFVDLKQFFTGTMVVMMNQNDIVAMGAPAVTFHGWNCDGCIRLDSPSAILACLISACDTG